MLSARTTPLIFWARGPVRQLPCIFSARTHPCSPLEDNQQWRNCRKFTANSSSSISVDNIIPRDAEDNRTCTLGSLAATQAVQVSVYVDTLLEWNQRMNLTAVTERGAVLERHVGDSLALLPAIDQGLKAASDLASDTRPKEPLRVVDVGSGAGLPGLVFAIARPEWEVTLLESLRKRCDFLEHVVDRIGLKNVRVLCARAEDAGRREDVREKYDVAVARAVADLRVLCRDQET